LRSKEAPADLTTACKNLSRLMIVADGISYPFISLETRNGIQHKVGSELHKLG
jgi:hypothetical protein